MNEIERRVILRELNNRKHKSQVLRTKETATAELKRLGVLDGRGKLISQYAKK